MPFKIPSLEEARRKQEKKVASASSAAAAAAAAASAFAKRNEQDSAESFSKTQQSTTDAGGQNCIIDEVAQPPKNKPSSQTSHSTSSSATTTVGFRNDKNKRSWTPDSGKTPTASTCKVSCVATTRTRVVSVTNPYAKSKKSKVAPIPTDPGNKSSQTGRSGPYCQTASSMGASAGGAKDASGSSTTASTESQPTTLSSRVGGGGATGKRSSDATEGEIPGIGSQNPPTLRDHHLLLQPHVMHVSKKQRGNGVLNFIRNVPYTFSTMIPDYIMGSNRCALFLSCRYHSLHPTYIDRRIAELKNDFDLRVLLCLVDVEDNANTLLHLNKLCVINNITLMLAWSEEEAARYLETLKAFEGRDASAIQRREHTAFADQITDVLTSVRGLNKTDAAQVVGQFGGTFQNIVHASMDELSLCPGMGAKKVQRLYAALHVPFQPNKLKKTSAVDVAAGENIDAPGAEGDTKPSPIDVDQREAHDSPPETSFG